MNKKNIIEKFKEIKGKPLKTTMKGDHAIGDFFEVIIGKQIDNKSKYDLEDGYEIKTKNINSKTMTTLFTKEPMFGLKAKAILDKYGYMSNGKKRFNSTITRVPNNKNFYLEVTDSSLNVKENSDIVCGWALKNLRQKFVEKMPNIIYVEGAKIGEYITYLDLSVFEDLNEQKLLDELVLDFRINEIKNYGTAFRIKNKLSDYYFHKI